MYFLSYKISHLPLFFFRNAVFLFAKSDKIGGKELYLSLKERGVLIRHFESERIKDFNRITVGSREEMEIFLKEVREIIGGKL